MTSFTIDSPKHSYYTTLRASDYHKIFQKSYYPVTKKQCQYPVHSSKKYYKLENKNKLQLVYWQYLTSRHVGLTNLGFLSIIHLQIEIKKKTAGE